MNFQRIGNLPKLGQGGFTLVELMVAGVLGLILIAGVIQLFVGTSQNSRLSAGLASLQDSGRFASQFLVEDITRSGWSDQVAFPNQGVTLNRNVVLASGTRLCASASDGTCNGASANTSSVSVITAHSDRLRLQYNGTTNCLGQSVNGGAVGLVVNTYFLANVTAGSDGIAVGDLVCSANNRQDTIVSGVESFQVQLGIDVNSDGTPDRFVTANDSLLGSSSTKIVAVRFGLLLASDPNVLDGARNYTSNEVTVLNESALSRNDRRLRRLFQRTVATPNNPGVPSGQ